MNIINLTQGTSTQEQKEHGVVDLKYEDLEFLKRNLTFTELPTLDILASRCKSIASLVKKNNATNAMIGGPVFITAYLERFLKEAGITVHYAFQKREEIEINSPNAGVSKIIRYKHLGFITK